MFDGLGFTEQIPPSLHDKYASDRPSPWEFGPSIWKSRTQRWLGLSPTAEGEGQQQEDRFQTEWPQAGASD